MLQPSVEGVLGLSWGFALPDYDIIKGTSVDYMHCICEGVVDQHLDKWFGTGENTAYPCFMGKMCDSIDKDLLGIKPIAEITRKARKITDRNDWKGNNHKLESVHYLALDMICNLSSDAVRFIPP